MSMVSTLKNDLGDIPRIAVVYNRAAALMCITKQLFCKWTKEIECVGKVKSLWMPVHRRHELYDRHKVKQL